MSLINKINFQYKYKLFKDLESENKYEELLKELMKINENKKIFFDLAKIFVSKIIKKNDMEIFSSKIIWLNSFLLEDLSYLKMFLSFYFSKTYENIKPIKSYAEEISSFFEYLGVSYKLDFNDHLDNSYLYQWAILQKTQETFKFVANQMPFFSTNNNFNFTKPTLTNCFISIIDNPYKIYNSIKVLNNNDIEMSRNILLNLDGRSKYIDLPNLNIEINRQGWHTNTLSWKDPNVINSLRGKIILKDELIDNTSETLGSIIFHLIQSGVDITLDYELIKQFVDQNPFISEKITENVSIKEKKFLKPYLDNILSDVIQHI